MTNDVEKHDNFQRLATHRTNRALKYIDMLGNLTSNAYIQSQEELDQIIDILSEAVNKLKDKYNTPKKLSLEFKEDE